MKNDKQSDEILTRKADLERQLEHYIKAISDPKIHENPENKKMVEGEISRLTKELKRLEGRED